jgi:hypothetical protein
MCCLIITNTYGSDIVYQEILFSNVEPREQKIEPRKKSSNQSFLNDVIKK